jgi:subtilisin family serine protease
MRRTALTAALIGLVVAAAPAAGAPTVLAELRAGADPRDVARDNGATLVRSFPEIGWAEYETPDGEPVAAARGDLLDDRRVFRLDFARRGMALEPLAVPNDTYTASPLRFFDGVETDFHWEQARFYPAWDRSRASLATRVAVLDSEIDGLHPEIAPKVVAAYNAELGTPGYQTPDTRASQAQIDGGDLHGTHVAGIAAAATNNGAGVSGAGFDAGLMPVKITLTVEPGPAGDATYEANAIDGILWAANNGARVLNMSFGTTQYQPALAAAVAYGASRDVLLVAAAGNSQDDPGGQGATIYPAALPDVLSVGATDHNGAIAGFSTNNPSVDVSAPGVRILSTWDTRAEGAPLSGGGNLSGYFVLSGTSMASPVVAGLGALVRGLRPDLTAAQAQAVIVSTAADRGAPGRDDAYGTGLIDADAAVRAAAIATSVPPDPAAPATNPQLPSPLRPAVRIRYRCTVGKRLVRLGTVRRLAVPRNARLVCRGTTAPALRRSRLQVQRLVRGRWTRIALVPTTARGRFGFVVRLRAPGTWTVRAALVGSRSRGPRASVTVGRATLR